MYIHSIEAVNISFVPNKTPRLSKHFLNLELIDLLASQR